MSIRAYTASYRFPLINFDSPVWSDDDDSRWQKLDGILAAQNTSIPFAATSGTANAIALNFTPDLAVVTGTRISFRTNTANTGAATVTVDGVGPYSLLSNGAALNSGDLPSGIYVSAVYNGTAFDVILPTKVGAGTITPDRLSTGGPVWDSTGSTKISPTIYGTSTAGFLMLSASPLAQINTGGFVNIYGSTHPSFPNLVRIGNTVSSKLEIGPVATISYNSIYIQQSGTSGAEVRLTGAGTGARTWGTGSQGSDAGSNVGNFFIVDYTGSAVRYQINVAGTHFIGSGATCDNNGNGNFLDITIRSDRRIKEVKGDIDSASIIPKLKVYEGKKEGRECFFFIADEVQEVLPQLVTDSPYTPPGGGPKLQQVDILSMIPILVAELQRQSKLIEELQRDRSE